MLLKHPTEYPDTYVATLKRLIKNHNAIGEEPTTRNKIQFCTFRSGLIYYHDGARGTHRNCTIIVRPIQKGHGDKISILKEF